MEPVFTQTLQVNVDELDDNSHVNNVVYVQWMQDIAVQHSEVNGCTRELYRKLGTSWLARSHKIDYVQPAVAGDTVLATTWLSSSRKVSCIRKYNFTRAGNDQLLAGHGPDPIKTGFRGW